MSRGNWVGGRWYNYAPNRGIEGGQYQMTSDAGTEGEKRGEKINQPCDRMLVRIVPLTGVGKIGHSLTYEVPEAIRSEARIGSVVAVEVRKSLRIGVITSFEEYDETIEASPYAIKHLRAIYTDEVLLRESDVGIARWVASYYACSLRDALAPFTPEVRALQATTLLTAPEPGQLHDAIDSLGLLFSRSDAIPVEERADGRVRIARTELIEVLRAGGMSEEAGEAKIGKWLESGILGTEIGIRTRIRQIGRGSWLSLPKESRETEWAKIRSERQKKILNLLGEVGGTLSRDEIVREVPGAKGAISTLVKKGLLEEIVDSSLVPDAEPAQSILTITDSQRGAIEAVTKVMDAGESRTFLLFGVTGSGKTEVYLEICRHAIKQGKKATVLVPEIALTYQTVRRFMYTFPRRIALLHSELTERERLHEWRAIRRGERDIVIGARSALFAPMPDRSVIVIDEESETAYKQQQRPRYHAREVARRMAKEEKSVLVMGSATPSIESYHAARKGTYTLLQLPLRVVGGQLPDVRIVKPDNTPANETEGRETVSIDGRDIPLNLMGYDLRTELKKTLTMGRQAILFLNLRGFAQCLICPKCGWVPRCPSCEISLTYHRQKHAQLCHHCGYQQPAPDRCEKCNHIGMKYLGWGTERLETEVRTLFPNARTLRMDRDSVSSRGRRRTIVEAVRKHEVDVLLGTQMIAKGLDFPSVRLVGVISADQSLHVPDFRAAERTFQLLTQVIGRAGRSEVLENEGGGIAIIQSYNPHSRILETASAQDFETFYTDEIVLRERFLYPPAVHLARVVFSGKVSEEVEEISHRFTEILGRSAGRGEITVLGPAPAPFQKLEGKWRHHCVIKAKRVSSIVKRLLGSLRQTRVPRTVKLEIDIDPLSML